MESINIHEAKTHLSRRVEQAAKGEPLKIARAGKSLIEVDALDVPVQNELPRLGFMAGQLEVPDAFGRPGAAKIEKRFCA